MHHCRQSQVNNVNRNIQDVMPSLNGKYSIQYSLCYEFLVLYHGVYSTKWAGAQVECIYIPPWSLLLKVKVYKTVCTKIERKG